MNFLESRSVRHLKTRKGKVGKGGKKGKKEKGEGRERMGREMSHKLLSSWLLETLKQLACQDQQVGEAKKQLGEPSALASTLHDSIEALTISASRVYFPILTI